MKDPVVAADGFTYEKAAIRSWLKNHSTSPMTNMRLRHKELVPNLLARTAIQTLKVMKVEAEMDCEL
jgi:U-box domain